MNHIAMFSENHTENAMTVSILQIQVVLIKDLNRKHSWAWSLSLSGETCNNFTLQLCNGCNERNENAFPVRYGLHCQTHYIHRIAKRDSIFTVSPF